MLQCKREKRCKERQEHVLILDVAECLDEMAPGCR
jgi:hypothetical protein